MKKIIVQLSDLHIRKEQNLILNDASFEKFFSFLAQKEFDEINKCYIVFSGDLTYSGFEKEFNNFVIFKEKLSSFLLKTYKLEVEFFAVPGNHDLNLTSNTIYSNQILEYEKNDIKKLDCLSENQLKQMKTFFKTFPLCFPKPAFLSNRKADNFDFVLINSAIFSDLNKIDKEHHHIPKYVLEGLNDDNLINSISFAIIHHRPDWFNYKTSSFLTDFFEKNINVCFCGHEHKNSMMVDCSSKSLIYLNSGELVIKNNVLYGSTNVLIIDDDGECLIESFNIEKGKASLETIYKKTTKLTPKNTSGFSQSFSKELKVSLGEKKVDLKNIFVMPFLLNSQNNLDDIDSIDDLIKILKAKNKLFLYGRSGYGKTTLINRLLTEFEYERKVILLDGENITNNFESNFEQAYEKIYGSSRKFDDIKSACCIVFVDQFEKIDNSAKRDKFIKFLNINFDSYLLVSSLKQNDYDNEQIKILDGLTIHGFSLKQRHTFIENICSNYEFLTEEDIQKVKAATELSFSASSMIDLASPFYILMISKEIIENEWYKQQNVSDAFSLIFINDIDNRILKYGRKESLEDYLNVLSEIAFNVIKQEGILFSEDLIATSVKKCKEDYKNIKISLGDFINVFLSSRIIISENGLYKFGRNSILAYLASRKICNEYKNGDSDIVADLYQNIEIGLNTDILLFVLYQLKETSVLFQIKNLLNDALGSYEEINLNSKNNPILKMMKSYAPETIKQAENKKRFIDRLDSDEKSQIKNIENIEKNDLKKPDVEDNFIKTIQRALKLIEILSKAVSGFKSELKYEKRLDLMKCSVSSLLKVIYAIFDVSEKDANEYHKIFEEKKEKRIELAKNQGRSEKEIQTYIKDFSFENFMYDLMTTFLLNDMTYIAKIMMSSVSSPFINEIFDKNNYACYKLFQLVAYQENGGMQENFVSCLKEINDHEQEFRGNILLSRRVMRVFLITNYVNDKMFIRLANACGADKQKLLLTYNRYYKNKKK